MIRTERNENFWQKIHNVARNNKIPLRVMFELTYRCNFFCRHCYVPLEHRKLKELKTKEIFSILDQLKEIGCFYLGFTGGEPFMRKDILPILRYAKKNGFELIVYSNGALINKRLADELAALSLNKIDITIPAMSKSAFENISGLQGSHGRVFKAVALLHKNRINLGFKTCVLKNNESEIGAIQDYTSSLSAMHRLDDVLSRRLDGSADPYKYRGRLKDKPASGKTTDPEEGCDYPKGPLGTKNVAVPNFIKADKREPKDKDLFKCGVGLTQVAITPQGELKPCLMIDNPRFFIGSSFTSAWDKLKDFISKINPDENYKCNDCNLQQFCKWCPARSWLYSGSFTSCDPENRKKAEELSRGVSHENPC